MNQSPQSSCSRSSLLVLAVSSLVATAMVLRAWKLHVDPLDLPSGDAGYYALQALQYRQLLLQGELGAVLCKMSLPELHPFLHPLLLGLWSTVFGATQAALRSYGALVTLAALALLPLMGHRAQARGGLGAGLLVILLCLMGPYQPAHLFTCMTEPTSLLAWMLTLWLALRGWRDERPRAWLLLGAAITLASLVRYSNLPLLLTPLLLTDLVMGRGPSWKVRLQRWGCWLAPSLLVAACWLLVEPAFARAVKVFLINSQSSSTSNGFVGWLWVPWAIATRFSGTWLLTGPLALLFLGGLLPLFTRTAQASTIHLGPLKLTPRLAWDPRTTLLQLTVLVGLVALAIHPLKVTRNLSALVPLLYLAALLPWSGTSLRWGGTARSLHPWSGLTAAAAFLLVYVGALGAGRAEEPSHRKGLLGQLERMSNDHPDHYPQPEFQAVLDFVEPLARQSRWLLVEGWGFADALLPLWAADAQLDVEVIHSWDSQLLSRSAYPPTEPAELAGFVLIAPPFPPQDRKGERDASGPLREALRAAGVAPADSLVTSSRWRIETWQQPRSEADSLRVKATREAQIARELDVKR